MLKNNILRYTIRYIKEWFYEKNCKNKVIHEIKRLFYCFIFAFFIFLNFWISHPISPLNNKWQLIRKTDNNKSMITSSSTTSTKIFIFSHFQTSCFGLFYQGLKPFWPQIMLEILFSIVVFTIAPFVGKILYNQVHIQRQNRFLIWKLQEDKFTSSPNLLLALKKTFEQKIYSCREILVADGRNVIGSRNVIH